MNIENALDDGKCGSKEESDDGLKAYSQVAEYWQ